MKMMAAVFQAEGRTLKQAADAENKTFQEPYEFTIEAGAGGTCVITGGAQFVMFVIGYMAACGEEGLLSVRVFEA